MNYERSRDRDKSPSRLENNTTARPENQIEQIEFLKTSKTSQHRADFHQSNSSHQLWQFGWQHFRRSYFCRGFFWGSLISFTSVFSALCGAAVTKIDAVERMIAPMIGVDLSPTQPVKLPNLARKIDVLLVEVESDAQGMIELPDGFVGKSKAIFWLRFEPGSNSTQIIDIPLDTQVKIPHYGLGTVADAYRFGGTELLIQTIARLTNMSRVDRYICVTPSILQRLNASSEIAFNTLDSKVRDYRAKPKQTLEHQNIDRRLNIPGNLDSFKTAVIEVKPLLDTNMSVPEVMSLANFVKQLDPDSISVDLLPGYIPGKSIYPGN